MIRKFINKNVKIVARNQGGSGAKPLMVAKWSVAEWSQAQRLSFSFFWFRFFSFSLKRKKMNKAIIVILMLLLISPHSIAKNKTIEQENNIINAGDLIEGAVEENVIFSLNQCIAKALANNPEIKAAISDTAIFQSRIGQAKSAYFPRLSLSSGYTRSNPLVNTASSSRSNEYYDTYNFSAISLNQLVYDFGKTPILIKISKLNHESSENQLQATINEITYRVKDTYYYLLFTQKQKDVMIDNVNKFQKHLNQAKAFYEVGTRPKIDVTIAEYNLSNAKLSLIKAKNEVEIAFAQLNNAMGLPKEVNYSIQDNLTYEKQAISFDEILKTAYENRPDLKAAKLKTQASERLVKFSKKAAIPDIKASTTFNVGGSDFFDDEGFGAGINLELPIANAYKVKKQVDEAKAQYEKEIAQAEKLEQDVFLQTKQAFIKFIEAEEKIPVSELLLEQAKANYDLASGRYKVGLGDSIELKDAEIEYRNAQMEYYNSILEYNISIANLERVVGADI